MSTCSSFSVSSFGLSVRHITTLFQRHVMPLGNCTVGLSPHSGKPYSSWWLLPGLWYCHRAQQAKQVLWILSEPPYAVQRGSDVVQATHVISNVDVLSHIVALWVNTPANVEKGRLSLAGESKHQAVGLEVAALWRM
eukprot:scaffold50915_cov66-Phaeocystis_antarctica.AAC.5